MNITNSFFNSELDQSDMKGAIASFSKQISTSFSIMEDWRSLREYLDIQKIKYEKNYHNIKYFIL